MADDQPRFLEVGKGNQARQIAVRLDNEKPDKGPGLVWLGGYRSDMLGTKAEALSSFALERGLSCCRHDYSGHGESGGEFTDGTISRWLEESLAVFESFTKGPQILIGSSMGAWIALRMAEELGARGQSERLHAMALLAPAPDFTHELMLSRLDDAAKAQLKEKGFLEEPSEYSDEPNIFTLALVEDGEKNRVMTGNIETGCPVHILQGMEDEDVPWQHAMKLAENMANVDLTMTIVRDGDHRLSRPQDIGKMLNIIEGFCSATL